MSEFSRNLAFIIGINNYTNGISPLQNAENDAKKLIEILREQHGYQIWVCLNELATLNNLNQLLEQTLLEQVGENDRLLFYFAGHGIALNGDDGPAGYLIPQDAQLGDTNTYLPMAKLLECLEQLRCRHFLGILDCCFAGAFRWSSTRDLLTVPEVIHKERYDRFISDPAWQVITSTAYDQKALDAFDINTERGKAGNHSPFAGALIEALAGKADVYPPSTNGKASGDGVITATELYLYLRDAVEPATEERRQRQTPGIWSLKKHDKGEYIFLSPGHPLNLPPAPPLDASKNPYRGLKSFEEKHSEMFFGRTELVKKLQDCVKTHPLTVVLGASGSGKSSLVKAGLIPQLRKETTEQWSILPPIRPGKTPLQALNNALKKAQLPEVTTQNLQQNLARSIDVWAKRNPNTKLLAKVRGTLQKLGYTQRVKEYNRLEEDSGRLLSVVFSPDGQMLAASANFSNGGTIKLWKRDNSTDRFATQPDIIPEYIRSIRSVAFSPDGQELALGTEDKTVILLNLQDRVVQTLTGHTGWVFSVAFSPDKKTLTLASSTDRTVKLWRFEGKKLPTLSNIHNRAIWRIAISPNGEMLASASIDGTVKLWKWDASTGQFETQPYKTLAGHRNSVGSVAFSPDGQTIATASDDKTVKLWSIGGQELQTLSGHNDIVHRVAFSPDGQIIATASDDKTVKFWKRDDSTGEFAIQPYKTLTGHKGAVYSVAFSRDGQTIATASDDRTVKLWNLDLSQELQTLTGHKAEVNSVVFSPDGQMLASASHDRSIKLWKRNFTGQFETQSYKTLTGHTTWVTDVAFSPDGQMLASASEDTTVKLWTLEGKELQTLYGHGDGNWIRSIVFRPNDKKIVSAGTGKVILWNLEDLSLDKLMEPACAHVRNYLQNNPNVNESDRHLCDN